MKKIKLLDILINLSLISWFLYRKCWTSSGIMIEACFTVGSWQVVSMLLHAYLGWFTKKWGARYIYHWIVFISVITIPAGSFWILGVTGAPMAVFYTMLCMVETIKIKDRPLSILK